MSLQELTSRERASLAILTLLLAMCGCLMHCRGLHGAGSDAAATTADSVRVDVIAPSDTADTMLVKPTRRRGDKGGKARNAPGRESRRKSGRDSRHEPPAYRSPLDEPAVIP